MSGTKVYMLVEAGWTGDTIHAIFASGKDARHALREVKAEAKRHRLAPDTAHDLERNLYIQEFDLLSEGDRSVTFSVVSDPR